MFKKITLCLSILSLFLTFTGCSSEKPSSNFISGKVQVVVIDRMQNPIKDAQVIFVSNNKYISKTVTDQQGKTGEISINAQPDPLIMEIMNKSFQRGTVNIIVSKSGYKDNIVFDAWVYENTISNQIIKLDKAIQGEQNEPEYSITVPHRLEVIKYVDYYKNAASSD